MHDILGEAFDLLGPDIVLAHAKDLNRDGDAGDMAAGTGVLDYDFYLSQLQPRDLRPAGDARIDRRPSAAVVAFLRQKVNDEARSTQARRNDE